MSLIMIPPELLCMIADYTDLLCLSMTCHEMKNICEALFLRPIESETDFTYQNQISKRRHIHYWLGSGMCCFDSFIVSYIIDTDDSYLFKRLWDTVPPTTQNKISLLRIAHEPLKMLLYQENFDDYGWQSFITNMIYHQNDRINNNYCLYVLCSTWEDKGNIIHADYCSIELLCSRNVNKLYGIYGGINETVDRGMEFYYPDTLYLILHMKEISDDDITEFLSDPWISIQDVINGIQRSIYYDPNFDEYDAPVESWNNTIIADNLLQRIYKHPLYEAYLNDW